MVRVVLLVHFDCDVYQVDVTSLQVGEIMTVKIEDY